MITVKTLLRRTIPRSARNWIRSPKRSLTWAWDEVRHAAGYHPGVELRPGWCIRCHPAARRAMETPQRGDASQIEELDAFIASCRPGMILFDIGAHFGLFSLAALHFGGPQARALAVEPSASAARMAKLEAQLNGVSSRLRVLQAAAGDRSGWHDMLAVGVIADGYYVEPDAGRSQTDLVRVRGVTIDELAAESGLAPTHLKIDVEGAEARVLHGARGVLGGKQPPVVFLELHNALRRATGGDPTDCLAELTGLGYRVLGHDGATLSPAQAASPSIKRIVARREGVPQANA